jgi:hypothetical protein
MLTGKKLFLLSLIAVMVFVAVASLILIYSLSEQQTASFTIPSKGQYKLGEIFSMNIKVDNINNPINVVQADLKFDPSMLEVVSISTKDSFANIFVQKESNNEEGYVRLTGGLPNPGWHGKHGLFGKIYFKTKQPGLVTITYLPTSLVLANDGKGTNILKSLPSVSYLILPDKLSIEEERMQRGLISKEDVLGANTQKNQLDFSKDTDN